MGNLCSRKNEEIRRREMEEIRRREMEEIRRVEMEEIRRMIIEEMRSKEIALQLEKLTLQKKDEEKKERARLKRELLKKLIVKKVEKIGNVFFDELRKSYTWLENHDKLTPLKLTQLNVYDREYKEINFRFRSTTKKYVHLQEVFRVENHFLIAAYSLKKFEMESRLGRKVEEMTLFHGTDRKNLGSICTNNFNWRRYGKNKGHRFGKGVSFSPISFYATHYGDQDIKKRVMIVAKVLVGNDTIGNKNIDFPPFPYDTTTNFKKDVYVKYVDNEFYPAYIIHYSL